MYTVLIAEDELLVRIGMVNCVPWAKLGMRIVEEVVDGQAAWRAFQQYRPDIIITDIRMPEMDGLELLRRIRAVDQNCAVIIVTNVEKNEMMEELRSLGVAGIMLKAVMTHEDIVETVIRARDSLSYVPKNTTAEIDHKDLWRGFLLEKNMDYDAFCRGCSARGIAPEQIKAMVLVHLFLDETSKHRMKYSMVDIVEHRMQEANSLCCVETPTGALLLLKNDVKRAELEYTLKELAWYIDTHFAVRVGFVLQPECDHQHNLPEYAARAMKIIMEPAYFDEPVFWLSGSGRPEFQKLRQNAQALMRYEVLSCESKYRAAIYGARIERMLDMLDSGWDCVREQGQALLRAFGADDQCDNLNMLVSRLTEAAESAIMRIKSDTRSEVLAAMEYIEDHLQQDLSIQSISQRVNYHYVYFSNLFKKETGMNYSDFVANVRINRAKQMLSESDYTLQAIADECGFKNVPYFCSKFKHMTGLTPGQWREKTCRGR